MSYVSASKSKGIDPSERLGLHKYLERTRNIKEGDVKKPVVGSWLQLPGHHLARMVAGLGFEFVLIDMEHGDIDDAEMHRQVAAVAYAGSSPIVRITAPRQELVKRVLDAGAHGIMVPMMNTAAEARQFVSYCRFPSRLADRPSAQSIASSPYTYLNGVRGAGSPIAPMMFNQSLGEYLDTANRNIMIIVQIETEEGLENCVEIAKVEGIDMLFVGPNDLCSSLGFPPLNHPNEPVVQSAINRILAAAKSSQKYSGIFCTTPEQIKQRSEEGFDLMNLGMDTIAIPAWFGAGLAKLGGWGMKEGEVVVKKGL